MDNKLPSLLFRPMKEHLELRGCIPFADKYERFFAAQKNPMDIISEGIACERRLVDILRFMRQLYGPRHGGYTAPEAPDTRSVQEEHDNSNHNDDSTVLPDDDLQDEGTSDQAVEQPDMDVSVVANDVTETVANFDDDDLDDEVITFKPAFSKRVTTPSPVPNTASHPSTVDSLVHGAAIAEQSAALLLDAAEQATSRHPGAPFSPLPSIDTGAAVGSGRLDPNSVG